MSYLKILVLFIVVNVEIHSQNTIWMPSIWSDNMVLQQQTDVKIWGKGSPNEEIEINCSWGKFVNFKPKSDSTWEVVVETPKAGGPYEITISTAIETLIYKNILVGEVWLCSGQSNMEMPLKGWPPKDIIINSDEEIKNANNPSIRLFTVIRKASLNETNDCEGIWEICDSNSASNFSATAYFFGKQLFSKLNIPIGLIHSSWGGTPAESWTNKKFLSSFSEYDSILQNIENAIPQEQKYTDWLKSFNTVSTSVSKGEEGWFELNFNDSDCHKIDYDDNNWPAMQLPTKWEESDVGEFNGVVWFRKQIKLPETWLDKELTIELGPIDDYDITYINGNKVGSQLVSGNWKTNRIYSIPSEINNRPVISISVRVYDHRGGGGIYGEKDLMNLTLESSDEKISLAGEWKYFPVAEFNGREFFVLGDKENHLENRPYVGNYFSGHVPSTLYNGMISPLTKYAIKGTIWYQGESNTDNPIQYERLFPNLINSWRNEWGYDFPFYFVQIAPYTNYGELKNSAYLRDAQRKTLNVTKTGMAVTLDIGDINNIHPANKFDVGKRLALIALANEYGNDVVYSGPLFKSMMIAGNRIELYFDHIGSGLELKNKNENLFLIAGADKKFEPADVRIVGEKVIVSSKNILTPLAVRYAWTNNSEGTLFNKEGLPASSFRTDGW